MRGRNKLIVLLMGLIAMTFVWTNRGRIDDKHDRGLTDNSNVEHQNGPEVGGVATEGKAGRTKQEKKHGTTSRKKTRRPPIEHIIYVKAHKAASTTVQSLFFRYGYTRNLSYVVSTSGHYINNKSRTLKQTVPPLGDHYDILCNHGFFDYSAYSGIMPKDSVYIGIVREPAKQFISSFNYYFGVYKFPYLVKIPGDKLKNLIEYPSRYDESPLSYTMNSMARDYGFTEEHLRSAWKSSNSSAHGYLEKLGTIFDLVLVAEYLDESIILMKRYLNWSLKDVLYIAKNVHGAELNMDAELLKKLKRRNILDFMLYDYFLKEIKRKIKKAGPDLIEETTFYKSVLLQVYSFCLDQYFGEYKVEASKWSAAFTVNSRDCQLMSSHELSFVDAIRKRQLHIPTNETDALR